jgi:hypothetical protein
MGLYINVNIIKDNPLDGPTHACGRY